MDTLQTDRLIVDLLNKYKQESDKLTPNDNIELEVRFKDINRDGFISLYNTIVESGEFAPGVLECSLNTISENVFERSSGSKYDSSQYIRKIAFNKGIAISEGEYIIKQRITKPVHVNDYIKYSVGLSKETISRKFATSTSAIVRFKARISFDYLGLKPSPAKWRFDLTAIRHGLLAEIGPNIKKIKDSIFTPSLSDKNFIDELNFDEISGYEVEIEYIDKANPPSIEDLEIAKKVFALINPEYIKEIAYREEMTHVAKYTINNPTIVNLFKTTYGQRQLSNQVIALSKNTYYSDVYPPVGYYLTDKADGVRAIISINGNRCRVILSNNMLEFIDGSFSPGDVYVLDAELVTTEGKSTLWLFDAMVFENKDLCQTGFSERVNYLEPSVNIVSKYLTGDYDCKLKKYIRIEEPMENSFKEIYNGEHPYEVDGLIITEPGEPYHSTKNYKWKPYSHNTIDFLAIKCPQKMLGIKPYIAESSHEVYLLFVGISHKMREKLGLGLLPYYKSLFPETDGGYYPIQFSPSSNPLAYIYQHKGENIHGKIVELSRNDDNTEWKFLRIREDRKVDKNYYGNDFRTAELTYMNYIDPFDFETLWKGPESYFTKTAGDMYVPPNKYKRFVISMLFKNNLSGSKWIIDEAAGRGADLHRYQEIGVQNALFIDTDPTAIAELVRRKFDYFAAKKRRPHVGGNSFKVLAYDRIQGIEYEKLIIKDVKSLTTHTLVADLKQPADTLVKLTAQYGINPGIVDGVVCNFAFHYLCDTIEHMREILLFNSRMLKTGGKFIITIMNGQKVFDLLKPIATGQTWKVEQDGIPKYGFVKKYTGDKLTTSGQIISVLLPFTDEWLDEPLCNVDTVINEARKLKLEVELNGSFSKYMDQFKHADRSLYERLTNIDKDYIELFHYLSFTKIN